MDPWQYIALLLDRLYSLMTWQSGRIDQLEQALSGMQAELKRIASLPNQHIEKVEYSFEQLKIDRLDGTLVIGLSPADTGTIEQLDVAGQLSEDVPLAGSSPQSPPHPYAPVYDPVNDYILHAVPGMLDECARGRQTVPLSEAQKEQVRNDLLRQADERIRLYMRHYGQSGEYSKEEAESLVLELVKQDIASALPLYVDYYKEDQPHERTDSSGSDE